MNGLNPSYFILHTNLILWDAVDAHGGDGCEHHSDGDQAEELAGDGVPRVLQRQPQTLPDVPVTHFLEALHVSASGGGGDESTHSGRNVRRDAGFYLFKSEISSTDVSMLLTSLSSSQLR